MIEIELGVCLCVCVLCNALVCYSNPALTYAEHAIPVLWCIDVVAFVILYWYDKLYCTGNCKSCRRNSTDKISKMNDIAGTHWFSRIDNNGLKLKFDFSEKATEYRYIYDNKSNRYFRLLNILSLPVQGPSVMSFVIFYSNRIQLIMQ